MKAKSIFQIMALSVCLSACFQEMEIGVVTLVIKDGDAQTQKEEAVAKLYEHYQNSTKEGEAYEIVCKKNGRFILNFTPVLNFLTICTSPGSGWVRQYKDVNETVLKKLVDEHISIDDLDGNGAKSSLVDSLLTQTKRIYNVNTNGSPN